MKRTPKQWFQQCGIIILCLLLQNCTERSSDSTTAINRTDKFIQIPDAEQFEPQWSEKNEVTCHLPGDPGSMHPTNGSSSVRRALFHYLHKSLVSIDLEKGGLKPELVEEIPEPEQDGRTFTFRLRDDLVWDDGKPVSMEDVLFSLKACKFQLTDNPHAKTGWEILEDVRPDQKDPFTFTVVLKRSNLMGISQLTDCYIIQQSLFDPDKLLSAVTFAELNDTAWHPETVPALKAWADRFNDPRLGKDPAFIKGLGPYRLASWEEGQSLIMERKGMVPDNKHNPFTEEAFPGQLIFRIIQDPNAVMLALKSQEIDGSTSISSRLFLELKKDSLFGKNYHAAVLESYSFTFVAFNTRPDGIIHKKLFDDRRVRRAFALLTPVDQVIKTLSYGMNDRIAGPVLPLKADYNPSLKILPFDAPGAKRLLLEAGWKDTDGDRILDKLIDGKKTDFVFDILFLNVQPEWKDMALMMAESYASAGVKANLLPVDPPVLFSKGGEHDFDMLISAWGGNSLPEDHSELWHTASWESKGHNYTGFGNPATDAMLDSMAATSDAALYNSLSHRLQQIIYDEQPYIFVYQGNQRMVSHKRFGNVRMYKERPGLLINEWKLLK